MYFTFRTLADSAYNLRFRVEIVQSCEGQNRTRHVTRYEPALTSRSDVPFSGRLIAKRNPDCQMPSKEMARLQNIDTARSLMRANPPARMLKKFCQRDSTTLPPPPSPKS